MLEAHKGGIFFFFNEYVKQMDLDGKKVLGKDVLFYRHAFQHLELIDYNFKHCPTGDEWGKVEKIKNIDILFD